MGDILPWRTSIAGIPAETAEGDLDGLKLLARHGAARALATDLPEARLSHL